MINKPRLICFGVRCLLLLGLLKVASAQAAPVPAPPAPTTAATPAAVRAAGLQDNPLLQEKLSAEATNRALGDVLADLSHTLKVDLTTSPQIADQRVTLHLTDQPLYLLMERLPLLLSHLPDQPHGYYWEKLERRAKARPAFNLWRDLRSVQDEEHERGYPRREAAVMLRDMRNLSRLTSKERESYKGDFPFIRFPGISPTEDGPEGRALRDLTHTQIDALLDGEKIALDPAFFPQEIAAFRQKRRKDSLRLYNVPEGEAASLPALTDIPPALSLSRADSSGDDPSGEMRYHLALEGITDYKLNIDVYDTNAHPDPARVPPAAAPTGETMLPILDLTPLLGGTTVTPEQRDSLGFTTQALAKAAHVNLYCESFLKKPYVAFGARSGGLTKFKGTLPALIAAICAEWNYQAQKVGSDYLFWSRTGAQDRAVDVPDRLINKWRERQQNQGALTLADNAEIAATLTWPQVALTLNQTLPEARMGMKDYQVLHLLGLLSPAERDAAFSADGLVLAESSPWVQQAIAADIQQRAARLLSDDSVGSEAKQQFAQVTSTQYNQAVMTLRADQAGNSADEMKQMFWLNVSGGGATLFKTWLTISLPPPAKQDAPALTAPPQSGSTPQARQ